MNSTKLSIVIPVYNVEKYLDNCMQSVINQTLQEIEIILVDDESPDNCPLLCDDYAKHDSRIKVVHRKNGGLGFARNSGIDIATGEYITFLDSDDFVDLYAYEHLYKLSKENCLDALYYKFKRFSNNSEVAPEPIITTISEYSDNSIKGIMLDIIASEPLAKLDHKIECSSCTAIYRMDIIKSNNVRFHSERELISEDAIFNLDFLKHTTKIAFNDGRHYHYRMNPTSLTSTLRTDRVDKNHQLYEYIQTNISSWNLDDKNGNNRNCRLFIGNARSSIQHYLSSQATNREKKEWLNQVLSKPIWKEIYEKYDWSLLPLYQKLFFYACAKKHIILLRTLCKIKQLLSTI